MRTAISPRFAIRSFRIGKQSLYVRLQAGLLRYCFQYQLRTRANPQIVRQVFPADDPGGVDKKFRRTRDVVAVFSGSRMQNAEAANHVRCWIGKERIAVPLGSAQFVRLFGRVDTNRRHLNPLLVKLVQVLFETP